MSERQRIAAPRFFVPIALSPSIVRRNVELPQNAAHHAVRVVRLKIGDSLTLFNGEAGEYEATLTHIDKRGATVCIERFVDVERESPLAITLGQAIIASDAMDYVVRKSTELGVTTIQPLTSAHSAVLPSGERSAKRHAHWQQVAIAACEQCGRNRIPAIVAAQAFDAWLATSHGEGIILVPHTEMSIASAAKPLGRFTLLVGPEGGWSDYEIAAATRAGLRAVHLGPRVLRADTAGAAAMVAMQTLCGDFR